jgi:hypothetical protein
VEEQVVGESGLEDKKKARCVLLHIAPFLMLAGEFGGGSTKFLPSPKLCKILCWLNNIRKQQNEQTGIEDSRFQMESPPKTSTEIFNLRFS